MHDYSYLVSDHALPDISYRTKARPEVIHPRVVKKDGGLCVYARKEHVPLADFLKRLAASEEGLWVAGYRPSNGRQTTISFNQVERVEISPRLQKLLLDIAAGESGDTLALEKMQSDDGAKASPDAAGEPLTLDDLLERLARQKKIGALGEAAAHRYEHCRLLALGCASPESAIENLTQTDIGAGYDLVSEFNGEVRYIEVKSSVARETSFFVSENERKTLLRLGEQAYIYLVLVDENDPRNSRVIKELRNPFGREGVLELKPTAYFAEVVHQSETEPELVLEAE